MSRSRGLIVVTVLIFASLACQSLSGIRPDSPAPAQPSESDSGVPSNSESGNNHGGNSSDSNFPMTADAYNEVNIGDGNVLYYTRLSLEDVMAFYRDEYTLRGYTENELLTVVSDGVFSMVFDGDPSGKAVVIQSVDLGDGSRTVTIRLE